MLGALELGQRPSAAAAICEDCQQPERYCLCLHSEEDEQRAVDQEREDGKGMYK